MVLLLAGTLEVWESTKMNDGNKKILTGMKDIARHLGRSEATVLKLHREYGLPIKKIAGGWIGHIDTIDEWAKDITTRVQATYHK